MIKKSFQVKVFHIDSKSREHVMFCRQVDFDPSIIIPFQQIESVLHLLFGRDVYVQFQSSYYGKDNN